MALLWADKRLAVHLVLNNGGQAQTSTEGFLNIQLHADVWLRHELIVQSRILALLGQSRRIHGRKTTVCRLDRPTSAAFLETNHLQGAVSAKYQYGLFYQNELVAVASFSGGRKIVRDGVAFKSYELLRFANKCQHTVVGGLDKLIKHFVSSHYPDDLMTYADADWSDGRSYLKLGFELLERTTPIFFWLETATQTRHYPHRLPPKLTDSCQESGLETDVFLAQNGFQKVWNSGNIKFLKRFK